MRIFNVLFVLIFSVMLLGVTGHLSETEAQVSKSPVEPRLKISATRDGKVTDVEARLSGAAFLGGRNVLCCEADCGSETRACYAPASKCGRICDDFCDCGNSAGIILESFQSP